MFCSKCGMQSADGDVFCTNCGEVLKELNPVQNNGNYNHDNNVNSGNFTISKGTAGIRKKIKREAKNKPKSSIIFASLIYDILMMVLVIIFVGGLKMFSNLVGNSMIIAFLGVFVLFLMVGIIIYGCFVGISMSTIEIARGNKLSIADVFCYGFTKYKAILNIIGIILIFSIGVSIINLVPVLGSIATIILSIYFTPVLSILAYYFADDKNSDVSCIKGLKNCINVVNGHRIEYYGLMFSFVGWWILGIFTLGILYFWLIPYVMIANANYYRRISGECSFDSNETGLSNGTIVAIVVGGYILLVCFIMKNLVVLCYIQLKKFMNYVLKMKN